MFFAGAEGDVGSTNVHPSGGDMNDTCISFDNEMKSPGMARFVGRSLAGTILQVYDKVTYTEVDMLDIMHKIAVVPANVPRKEDLATAHKYKELHDAGLHEVLHKQGLMEYTHCLSERECLSEGQLEEIKRVYAKYPHLNDDEFIAQNIESWKE